MIRMGTHTRTGADVKDFLGYPDGGGRAYTDRSHHTRQSPREQEKSILEHQAKLLEQSLEQIKKRLEELKKEE